MVSSFLLLMFGLSGVYLLLAGGQAAIAKYKKENDIR